MAAAARFPHLKEERMMENAGCFSYFSDCVSEKLVEI